MSEKRKKNYVIIFLISLFLVQFVIYPIKGDAQLASLAVTPVKLELEDKLGASISEKIKVYNKAAEEVNITSYIQDYNIGDNNQYNFFDAGHLPVSSASWIKVNPSEFSIKPDNFQEVMIEVNIPKDAFSGTHNSILFFQTKDASLSGEKGAKVGSILRVGVPLLVVAKDSKEVLKREGSIKSFDITVKFDSFIEGMSWSDLVNPKAFFSKIGNIKLNFGNLFKPKITSKVVFEATGNTHVNIGGKARFENLWFGVPNEQDISSVSVLPQSKREFTSTWQNPTFFGPAKAKDTLFYPLSLGPEEWKESPIEKSFWIIPWQLIILILFLLGFLIALWKTVKWVLKRILGRDKNKESINSEKSKEKAIKNTDKENILDLRKEIKK